MREEGAQEGGGMVKAAKVVWEEASAVAERVAVVRVVGRAVGRARVVAWVAREARANLPAAAV